MALVAAGGGESLVIGDSRSLSAFSSLEVDVVNAIEERLEELDDLVPIQAPSSPMDEMQDESVRTDLMPSSSPWSSQDRTVLDRLSEMNSDLVTLSNKKRSEREHCIVSQAHARMVVEKYDQKASTSGWCRIVRLAPTKEHGYIQVSFEGANKFAVLQEVVVWAPGGFVPPGHDASHLCHEKRCCNVSHIISEEKVANQQRKGCLVWVPCHHCDLKIFVCRHVPSCIKFCEGFDSHEHFLSAGICMNINQYAE